ncbi:hypothetical protein [Nocardia arthritidis]|uniref:TetR family transcriptional regulator n=1 Tax=Nocardia arthritidis TaxID=228602 RepID=A0A6G9Y7L5_9NOCA|nr:hypothetical protein [Nocardia arthritidis]QIS09134.1 hypothetical protein F5544_06115 [Nocardia arthritidis]
MAHNDNYGRYSKEDIVLATVLDFGTEVAEALRGLPVRGNELESLCEAFLQVVDAAAAGGGPVPFEQFQQLQRIIRDAPSVAARQREMSDTKNVMLATALAERLGTTPDSITVRLVLNTWQVIGQLSMEQSNEAVLNGDLQVAARAARDRLTETYNEFVRTCAGARSVESL